jgi:hypothetical protein
MAVNETFDFADGTDQGWSLHPQSANETVTIDALAALNGSVYGVKITYLASVNEMARIEKTLATTYLDLYFQFWLKMKAGSAMWYNSWVKLLRVCKTADTQVFGFLTFANPSAGNWTITESLGSHSTALVEDTEYLIEVHFKRDASAGGFQIWVDESLVIDDLTHDTSAYTNVDYVQAGSVEAGNTVDSSFEMYLAKIKIGDAYIGASAPASGNAGRGIGRGILRGVFR